MNTPLLERYRDRIAGVLTCYVITGTLPGACHAAGMTSFLKARAFQARFRIGYSRRFPKPMRATRAPSLVPDWACRSPGN